MLLLLLVLWTLWTTRFSVVHKSTGLARGLAQIEPGDAMGAVVDVEAPSSIGRAKRDVLAAECLADAPGSVLEVDEAVAADLAHMVAGRVLDRRQNFGKGRELG